MGSDKWKRYIRVRNAKNSVLCFHGAEIVAIDSDDWVLDMEDLLQEVYTAEKDFILFKARVDELIVSGQYLSYDELWSIPKVLPRNILIILINELPSSIDDNFPISSKPNDVKWRKLNTDRCTEITTNPPGGNITLF